MVSFADATRNEESLLLENTRKELEEKLQIAAPLDENTFG